MSERLFPTKSDAITWSRHPDYDRLVDFLDEKQKGYSAVHEAIEKAAGRKGLDKLLSDEEYSLKSMYLSCLVNTLYLIKTLAEDKVNIGHGGSNVIEKFDPRKITYDDNLYLMYKDPVDGLNQELRAEYFRVGGILKSIEDAKRAAPEISYQINEISNILDFERRIKK